ncbi:MAG: oligosaccharide flippase family protein [Armatimonadia bacterium]|nr:oligosaccharide flippase family protein [Armatimonadia bacterium]
MRSPGRPSTWWTKATIRGDGWSSSPGRTSHARPRPWRLGSPGDDFGEVQRSALGWVTRLRSFLSGQSFGHSVLTLAGGTVAGQVLALAVAPILSRLYSPADFGVLQVYASALGMLTGVGVLCYERALPLPETEEEGADVLALCFAILLITSALLSYLVAVHGPAFLELVNAEEMAPYRWLLPLGLFGALMYQTLNFWAVRRKAFGRIAATKLTQAVGMVSVQIGCGILKIAPLGLLAADVVGRSAGVVSLGRIVFAEDLARLAAVRLRGIGRAALRYWKFPCFTSWTMLASTSSMHVPPVLLSAWFGSAVAGWFGLGARLMQAPIDLVGRAVAQVFFAECRTAQQEGSLGPATWRVFERLARVAAPIAVFAAVSSPPLMVLVLGEEWATTGRYMQWLGPWILVTFLYSPMGPIALVLERQEVALALQAGVALGRIGGAYVGYRSGSAEAAVIGCALGGAVMALPYVAWQLAITGNSPLAGLAHLARETALAAALCLPIIGARVWLPGSWLVRVAIALSAGLLGWRAYGPLRRVFKARGRAGDPEDDSTRG